MKPEGVLGAGTAFGVQNCRCNFVEPDLLDSNPITINLKHKNTRIKRVFLYLAGEQGLFAALRLTLRVVVAFKVGANA